MLYINNSKTTVILYDDTGNKVVLPPDSKIDDSVLPIVADNMYFIPYGVKRTPKRSKVIEDDR